MEISAHAVKHLRIAYPFLAMTTIDIGPAEKSIKNCADNSIDVIFTMSALEHLHPACRSLFQDIAPGKVGSLLFAISFMLVCWLVGYVLDKKKIYIRV